MILDDPFERQKDLKGSESNGTSKRKRSKDIRKSDLNNAGRAMWTIIDLIKETPGYKSFLSIDAMKKIPGFVMPSIPMDLSKLRKNLPIYQNQSPDIFFKDSLLIFDSMLASDVSSELLETADYLKQVAVENFNLYFTKSESGEFVVNDVPKRKPVKKKSLGKLWVIIDRDILLQPKLLIVWDMGEYPIFPSLNPYGPRARTRTYT